MLAVIYEPRGNPPVGRMTYVGWAILSGTPLPDSTGSGNYYRVNCREPMRAFERSVPRELGGEPVERWLRRLSRGRLRNSATRGRAVRSLSEAEVEDIFRFGATDIEWDDRQVPLDLPSEVEGRVRRVVTRLERSAGFREQVLTAYGNRCAVSGLAGDGIKGLIEAAHIKGAGRPDFGPDHVTNGVALTPTLHRLFDRHLFSFEYLYDKLVVVPSKLLTMDMVQDAVTGSALRLQEGQKVRLPSNTSAHPGRRFVDFHRRRLLK